MFKVNDYVVYGLTGVCQITDIEKESRINREATDYYVLRPVYNNMNNMIIKTPINNPKILIRKVASKQEISSLIATMPGKETLWIDDSRERSELYKAMLRKGECGEWIQLVKTLYLEKEARSTTGKTLTNTDEEIMKTAQKHLNEEFSIALEISPDEVLPYILNHIL